MAIKDITEAVLAFDEVGIVDLIKTEIAAETGVDEILNAGLIGAMDIVGQKYSDGELFVPEMLMAAETMKAGLAVLKPLLSDGDAAHRGTVVIGTAKGDLHDIGKNLVAMMMESAGMTVHNIGVDIGPEDFVTQIKEKNAQIVCLSALLTTTMPMMKQTIDAIVEAGLRDQVKIIVGGAPVTQAFADEIGADGFASDAGSAAKLGKTLAA